MCRVNSQTNNNNNNPHECVRHIFPHIVIISIGLTVKVIVIITMITRISKQASWPDPNAPNLDTSKMCVRTEHIVDDNDEDDYEYRDA
jgi:hypothetical protein